MLEQQQAGNINTKEKQPSLSKQESQKINHKEDQKIDPEHHKKVNLPIKGGNIPPPPPMNNSKKGPPLPPRPLSQENTITPPPPSDLPPPLPSQPLSQENPVIPSPPPSDLPPVPPTKNDGTNEALNKRNSTQRPGGEIQFKTSVTPLKDAIYQVKKDQKFDDKEKPKNTNTVRQKNELKKQKGTSNLKKLVNFFEKTKDEPQNSKTQPEKKESETKQPQKKTQSIKSRFTGFIYGKSKTDQKRKPVKIFRILEEIERRF